MVTGILTLKEVFKQNKIRPRKELEKGEINLDIFGLEFYSFLERKAL